MATAKEKIMEKTGLTSEQFLEELRKRTKANGTTGAAESVAWYNELYGGKKPDGQVTLNTEKLVPRGVELEESKAEPTTDGQREDFEFHEAKRTDTHMRISLFGVSGSGKTYSGLLLAKTLAEGGKIAVIDTEDNSAALYDDIAKFDTLILRPPYTPERYTKAVEMAVQKGYSSLLIDSCTHLWNGSGGILDIVDRITKATGNNRDAWREATPRYNHFLETIKVSPIHTICTVRTKTKLLETKDESGKKKMEKHANEPEMRDGIEYEFTTVLDIDISHLAKASKDRTKIFSTIEPQYITEKTGQLFLDWLRRKQK